MPKYLIGKTTAELVFFPVDRSHDATARQLNFEAQSAGLYHDTPEQGIVVISGSETLGIKRTDERDKADEVRIKDALRYF